MFSRVWSNVGNRAASAIGARRGIVKLREGGSHAAIVKQLQDALKR